MVQLQFLVVHATVAHSDVDAELRPLMPYFENYKYTGFNLINTKSAQLKNKDKKQFVIQGNRRVTITLLSHDDTKARMKSGSGEGICSGVKGRVLLDTTILVNRNGTFIVAGPKFKDGILVLPITANF